MFRKVTGFIVMLCAFLLISVSVLPWVPVNAAADFKVYADESGAWIVNGEPELCIENMAPGSYACAFLEVENKSSETITLAICAEFMGGCRTLFENLCIDIKDCYTGPLGGCQGNILGVFAAGCTERVPLEISLPQGTGNECQGKEVTVRFRITQLGDPENPFEPGEHPELPVTGTDVNFLLPLGLIMFLSGLLLMCSARSRQEK